MSKLDIVLFGATGFTGSLAAKYLSRVPGLRWAVAGRSPAKLDALRATLEGSASPPSQGIVASPSSEPFDGIKVANAAAVVLSTAGPFSLYSDVLVRCCATSGAAYVDINGEVPWVRRVVDRDQGAAAASGSIIVPNCGFDSVPSDLGAFLAARKAPGRPLEGHATMKGAMSGGTISTGILMSETFPGDVANTCLLGGDPAHVNPDVTAPRPPTASRPYWTSAFGMALINTRVVRRSAVLLDYGAGFGYDEYAVAPSEAVAKKMVKNAAVPPDVLRSLVDRGRLFAPGDGPDEATRAESSFALDVVLADSNEVLASVSGGDPGYDETAKMVSEAALALADAPARSALQNGGQGGVFTPAAAFGDVLVDRLRAAGLRFDA